MDEAEELQVSLANIYVRRRGEGGVPFRPCVRRRAGVGKYYVLSETKTVDILTWKTFWINPLTSDIERNSLEFF